MSKTAGHTAVDPLTFERSPHADDLQVIWRGGDKFACTKHEAHALEIVTAVNSHASNLRKVEALRDALRLVASKHICCCSPRDKDYCLKCTAERALALAEEQT